MKAQTTAQVQTRTHATDHSNVKAEASKGAIAIMAAVPGLIGLWSAACFVGAMAAGGGPLGMASSWFRAISGL